MVKLNEIYEMVLNCPPKGMEDLMKNGICTMMDDIGPEFPIYFCTQCAKDLGIKYDLKKWIQKARPTRRQCGSGRMCYCAPFEED